MMIVGVRAVSGNYTTYDTFGNTIIGEIKCDNSIIKTVSLAIIGLFMFI